MLTFIKLYQLISWVWLNPKDFEESKKVAKQGGNVAKVARTKPGAKTGKTVVTALNAKSALQLKTSGKKRKKK